MPSEFRIALDLSVGINADTKEMVLELARLGLIDKETIDLFVKGVMDRDGRPAGIVRPREGFSKIQNGGRSKRFRHPFGHR